MAVRTRRDKVAEHIRRHEAFSYAGLALTAIEGKGGTGRMEGGDLDRYRADNVAYTVYSYATPIAWVTTSGLIRISRAGYNVATRQHINICRVALYL
jgi:hypothetical protein